jgi:hypothetical protein
MKQLSEKEFLFWAIRQAVSGSGNFKINKEIKTLVIYISNNDSSNKYVGKVDDKTISYTDISIDSITNDIYIKIIEGNLISRLYSDTIFKCFLNGIIINVLRDMKRYIDNRNRILSDLKKDTNEDFNNSFIYKFMDQEEAMLIKERHFIIKNSLTNDEYLLLTGETTIEKFAKSKDMSIRSSERFKKHLCAKLLIILKNNGYNQINLG